MRLFTAITIPEEVKTKLQDLLTPLEGVKWQDRSQMHLTMRFIGEVDEKTKREIIEQLEKIRFQPFSIKLDQAGSFPPKDRGNPKVIWVGIQENTTLHKLQSQIEEACRKVGLKPDERAFKPHITLGRNKGADAEKVRSFMEEMTIPDFKPIHISKFYLFRSELRSGGAVHHIEQQFSLK